MVRLKQCGYGYGFRFSFGKGLLNGLVWVRVEIGELEDALAVGNGLLNGRMVATARTEEGGETVEEGRQIVSEMLHSKTPSYSAYNSVSTLMSNKQ